MSVKNRLNKIENKIRPKKDCGPIMMVALSEESANRRILAMREKYGEGYSPRLLILIPEEKRQDAIRRGIT